jgi:hypothetical protein
LRSDCAACSLERIYEVIPPVNFSSAICEPLAARLAVLPVPDVGWSDWGTAGSILRTLKRLRRFDAFRDRLEPSQMQPAWHSATQSRGGELDRRSISAGSTT